MAKKTTDSMRLILRADAGKSIIVQQQVQYEDYVNVGKSSGGRFSKQQN